MKQLDHDATGQHYQFECSGRTLYANQHIIGINPDLELSEGYDGHIGDMGGELTLDEQQELAAFMIELWTHYRDRLQ